MRQFFTFLGVDVLNEVAVLLTLKLQVAVRARSQSQFTRSRGFSSWTWSGEKKGAAHRAECQRKWEASKIERHLPQEMHVCRWKMMNEGKQSRTCLIYALFSAARLRTRSTRLQTRAFAFQSTKLCSCGTRVGELSNVRHARIIAANMQISQPAESKPSIPPVRHEARFRVVRQH